ncbi:hypothetical protein [Legionella sainthelensi]|uniref:hypothetical protein n=1 Tax=Legionella sainthelensi TaxID=28087 RepID=UPI000E200EC5|nr:hypothetical protein [Legionella sainthelensi]
MWNNLVSGLIGAVIAVIFTYCLQEYSKRKEYQRNVNRLLLAVKTEITVLQNRFNDSVVINENGPFLSYYLIEQNYFLVLEGQSSLLGAINNESLRALIIRTYIHAKSLIDTFKTNNIIVEKYESNHLLFLQEPQNLIFKTLEQAYLKILENYADQIRKFIKVVENNIQELVNLIDYYLGNNSFTCLKCGGQKIT